MTLTRHHARAIALAAQRLDRPASAGDPAALESTLEEAGFVRTLGGVDVYLALHARVGDLERHHLDDAAAERRAQVLPSARGCIYLVPQRFAGDALSLAEHLTAPRSRRELDKAGVEPGEIDRVGSAVLEVLSDGPLGTQALRKNLPEGLVRSLGDVGKKIGVSSTLPPTLRQLEFDRRIVRQVATGRLDTERYLWQRIDGERSDVDPKALHRRLAALFLRAAGVSTPRAFAAWSGLKQGESKAAFAGLDTVSVEVDGEKEPHAVLAERAAWLNDDWLESPGDGPDAETVGFLPFGDNLVALRGGPAFWVDPEHHGIPVPVWGRGRGSTLGDVHQSMLRPIVAGGRIVGFWEFDPDAHTATTAVFADVGEETRGRIESRRVEVGAFLAEQLGHGRSFSLDKDESLRRRVAQLKQLA
ncbi:MAG: crosslink repair DNA glycosylase YcaQ family protein [Acidobacteriota bacterium]